MELIYRHTILAALSPLLVRIRSMKAATASLVGDRLGDIEHQKIVEEDIRVGGERARRPIGLAVARIPVGETVLQALQEQRLQPWTNSWASCRASA
jgi:hypothetical protein